MNTSVLVNMSIGQALKGDARGAMRRVGAVLSAVAVLFLLMDAVLKLLAMPFVLEATAQLGYPGSPEFVRGLGALLLACTLLYAWPRTTVIGAILLTGYLGGAVATHARIHDPMMVMAIIVGVLVWLGIFLREPRLRSIAFWR